MVLCPRSRLACYCWAPWIITSLNLSQPLWFSIASGAQERFAFPLGFCNWVPPKFGWFIIIQPIKLPQDVPYLQMKRCLNLQYFALLPFYASRIKSSTVQLTNAAITNWSTHPCPSPYGPKPAARWVFWSSLRHGSASGALRGRYATSDGVRCMYRQCSQLYIYRKWVKLLNLHRWVLKYHEIWFVELHLFFVSISISICWSSRFPLWFTVVLFLMLDLQPWKKQGSNLNINNISRHMHACVLRIFYIIQYIDMHTHIHIFLYIYTHSYII